jgi:hypothetical protein
MDKLRSWIKIGTYSTPPNGEAHRSLLFDGDEINARANADANLSYGECSDNRKSVPA